MRKHEAASSYEAEGLVQNCFGELEGKDDQGEEFTFSFLFCGIIQFESEKQLNYAIYFRGTVIAQCGRDNKVLPVSILQSCQLHTQLPRLKTTLPSLLHSMLGHETTCC